VDFFDNEFEETSDGVGQNISTFLKEARPETIDRLGRIEFLE